MSQFFKIIITATLFTLSLVSQTAQATQYYQPEPLTLPDALRVINVASDSELSSAISNAQPGDRIVLADGNYNGLNLVGLKGSAANPIVFVAQNRRKAIITGSRSGRNIRLSDCEHLQFYSIRLTGADVWGMSMGPAYTSDTDSLGCHYIRVVDCEIDHAGQELLKINGNSSHIEVISNSLHHTGISGGNKPYAEGIYIGDGNSSSDRSHDILIQGNHIYNIGNSSAWGEAIDLKVQVYNITIVDNLIENVIVNSQGAITVLIGNNNYPSDATNPNILISRNVIRNVSHHSNGYNGAGISAGSNGVTITNNLIWETDESSLTATKNAANTTGGLNVYNNTFWDGVIINQSGLNGGDSPVDEVLKNNLINGSGGSNDDMSATVDDFIGPISGDAIAETYTGSGFKLRNDSSAIGAGAQLSAVTYDLTGALRPSGSYSMGAFEAIENPSTPILHEVTFTATSGGSVEGYVFQEVVDGGSTESVTAVPVEGYAFTGWTGSYVGNENPLILSNVSEDLQLTANFAVANNDGSPTVVRAINCGGSAYLSIDGISYEADVDYTGGKKSNRNNTIGGTEDDTLYKSERYGIFSYSIPVAAGDYTVTLQFAETYWNSDAARVFDCQIEGQVPVKNLDIHRLVGANTSLDVDIPVSVNDGFLDISFNATVDKAKINAILIQTRPETETELDSDGDGMPDSFELMHGLNPYNALDAQSDADGDGLSNLLEYAFNLDPNDPSDAIGNAPTTGLSKDGSDLKLEITFRRLIGGSGNAVDGYVVNGIRYQVQCNQAIGGTWETGSAVLEESAPPVDNGDGTETVRVRTVSTVKGTPIMFIRLKVSAI